MFSILAERTINKPIEEVFALITDHANYSQFKGVDTSRLVKEGSEDKNGLGAIREVVSGTGTLHEEIVRFTKPHEDTEGNKVAVLGYKIVYSTPLPYDHQLGEVTFTETNGQTHVHWVSKGRITRFLLGPLFFDKQIEKNGGRAFGSILKHVENI
jgi:uncharacterized protein YndB with AHSA1/START domain